MRKKKVLYFGEREEKAVVDYKNSKSFKERNAIYNEILKAPFQRMIESILRKYQTNIGSYEMEELEKFALSHLVEQMVKFDPTRLNKAGKKTKAFSYCQTIVRNYFKDHSKKSYLDKTTNLFYDDYHDEINDRREYHYEIDGEDHYFLEKLINNVVNEIEIFIDENISNLKENEIIVGEAIVNILKNWELLFLEDSPSGKYDKKVTNKFAKNKILLYLKEQTSLSTKEIRLSMKPYKTIYFLEKQHFFEEE